MKLDLSEIKLSMLLYSLEDLGHINYISFFIRENKFVRGIWS